MTYTWHSSTFYDIDSETIRKQIILTKWQEKIDASVERAKNSSANNRKKIGILVTCKRLIKENLKDPDSLKIINNLETQIRTGIVEYTATNSFGGRVRESATCFNPKDF